MTGVLASVRGKDSCACCIVLSVSPKTRPVFLKSRFGAIAEAVTVPDCCGRRCAFYGDGGREGDPALRGQRLFVGSKCWKRDMENSFRHLRKSCL